MNVKSFNYSLLLIRFASSSLQMTISSIIAFKGAIVFGNPFANFTLDTSSFACSIYKCDQRRILKFMKIITQ